jgi:hypothetical protein
MLVSAYPEYSAKLSPVGETLPYCSAYRGHDGLAGVRTPPKLSPAGEGLCVGICSTGSWPCDALLGYEEDKYEGKARSVLKQLVAS